jgi:glycosyltransferase involved in cell wall biosynthesis
MNVIIDGVVYQNQLNGGISRVFNELIPRICETDNSINVTLFTSNGFNQLDLLPKHKKLTYLKIPYIEPYLRPGRFWKAVVPSLDNYIRKLWIGKGNNKIWHSTYFTMPVDWHGKIITTMHDLVFEKFIDMFPTSYNRIRMDMQEFTLKSDAVICVSKCTKNDLESYYSREFNNAYVIHNACSEIFTQLNNDEIPESLMTDKPFILYIGQRKYYKNFNILISAFKLWKRKKDFRILLVGPPLDKEEEEKLSELGIRNHVSVLPNVNDKLLCILYNKAAAFVYPSLYEGFGIPLLEAMSCGCPLVASDIPSTREVAGNCPIYFDPTDIDSFICAIDLAIDKGRESNYVKLGLIHVKKYSWETSAKKTVDLYRSIL